MSEMFDRALGLQTAGRLAEAEAVCRQILSSAPDDFRTHHLLGFLEFQQGRAPAAAATLALAAARNPNSPEIHTHLGHALQATGKHVEAVVSYDKALALNPDAHEARYNRASALQQLGRNEEALAAYDAHIARAPEDAMAIYNRGILMRQMDRPADALENFRSAARIAPDFIAAIHNCGAMLREAGEAAEALAFADRAVSLAPQSAAVHMARGAALLDLHRSAEALTAFDRAISLEPNNSAGHNGRGNTLRDLRRVEEARGEYEKAVALDPRNIEAIFNGGNALRDFRRYGEALAKYERVLALRPGYHMALGAAADCALRLCDWARVSRYEPDLRRLVAEERPVIRPFMFLGFGEQARHQRQCAATFLRTIVPAKSAPLATRPYPHEKIRLAYLSADFHAHATAFLMAEVFERHDRGKFEVHAVSWGPDDKSAMRARLVAGFDHFHEVRGKSDAGTAKMLRDLEIDIAVDLKGYTEGLRTGILACRPAPVQVNYLGYPGTMAAPFIDYIIADPVVLPFADQSDFDEKIVHLPDCYQPNDTRRAIAATPTRAQAGLPEQGFVFASFNNNWKIAPDVFAIWMKLLGAVPGSILWLIEDNEGARGNLRRETAARGIEPARLIFAPKLPLDAHLARHRLADLFLDTLPYNAHTTASDALWTGLPIVTRRGESFAGRVAASLLHAIGLDELVTESAADYEALALALARDPARLAAIREMLARNIRTKPLFDTGRFVAHLESAYARMHERAASGEPPQSFAV